MRIYEITERNNIIIILRGIDINIDNGYNLVISLLNVLVQSNSPHRNQLALPFIEDFEKRISYITNTKYPEEADTDIIALRSKISNMQQQILSLKQRLKI